MNEDDTFNRLRKWTFEQVEEEWLKLPVPLRRERLGARVALFEASGWTSNEFHNELMKRLSGLHRRQLRHLGFLDD